VTRGGRQQLNNLEGGELISWTLECGVFASEFYFRQRKQRVERHHRKNSSKQVTKEQWKASAGKIQAHAQKMVNIGSHTRNLYTINALPIASSLR
jgi:hypothetical protein